MLSGGPQCQLRQRSGCLAAGTQCSLVGGAPRIRTSAPDGQSRRPPNECKHLGKPWCTASSQREPGIRQCIRTLEASTLSSSGCPGIQRSLVPFSRCSGIQCRQSLGQRTQGMESIRFQPCSPPAWRSRHQRELEGKRKSRRTASKYTNRGQLTAIPTTESPSQRCNTSFHSNRCR